MNSICFHSPSNLGCYGMSQSGKSQFCAKLLRNSKKLYTKEPEHILYCYSEMQGLFKELESELSNITFKHGLPNYDDVIELSKNREHTILVIDDMMTECQSNKFIERLFCVLSHHLSISLVYLAQNIFYQGRNSRTISLQLHYFVLFRNQRDKSQILTLARQIAPKQTDAFMEIYEDCLSQPYSYLVIDLAPNSNKDYKFRTNIFPRDDSTFPVVYKIT